MPRIKIAIEPKLKQHFGAEICWTWRTLLSGIGLSWEEVPLNHSACDIVYVSADTAPTSGRFCIYANQTAWRQPTSFRMTATAALNGCSHPLFKSQTLRNPLVQMENGGLVCYRDIIFDVFWLATGQEEKYLPKNKHGHFDLNNHVAHQEASRLALGSSLGMQLEKIFSELKFPAPTPRWPAGRRAAAGIGHDVDYPEVIRWLEPIRIIRRQGWRGAGAAAAVWRGEKTHWHFASWQQMEKCLGTRSAFFFVARQGSLLKYAAGRPDPFYDVRAPHFKRLFRKLTDDGFEIGLHASYKAYSNIEKFSNEKKILEEAAGQTVVGNRHHYWHLHPYEPESTLWQHEQIGMQYDTSLMHERYLGWRRGLSWPFFPFYQKERRELRTLQISTAFMDDHLFGHRQDNPGDRRELLQALADKAAEQGGCLLIDMHDYVYDDVLFPDWAKTYQQLWEYLLLRSDFWIATPGEIAKYWMKRHTSILQASSGLTGADGGV